MLKILYPGKSKDAAKLIPHDYTGSLINGHLAPTFRAIIVVLLPLIVTVFLTPAPDASALTVRAFPNIILPFLFLSFDCNITNFLAIIATCCDCCGKESTVWPAGNLG
uniref:Uncharacterized protein n=1 Tax=uncultured marine group II/III euryarchaeote KM3_194_G04 TaxID=1457969 RepID=A0A075GRQ4_9EURY|nr:hypothetical protein [uncultured marine group II/III euryarchaeote KM3_194_G04]